MNVHTYGTDNANPRVASRLKSVISLLGNNPVLQSCLMPWIDYICYYYPKENYPIVRVRGKTYLFGTRTLKILLIIFRYIQWGSGPILAVLQCQANP